jgi:hypothetical protein
MENIDIALFFYKKKWQVLKILETNMVNSNDALLQQ